MKFKIDIEEVSKQEFEIEACSEQEALRKASQEYKESKLIVDQPILLRATVVAKSGSKEVIY